MRGWGEAGQLCSSRGCEGAGWGAVAEGECGARRVKGASVGARLRARAAVGLASR